MKKVSVICIMIAVVMLAILPTAAFAETSSANLCLINPVAIASIGNYVFVADNVDADNNQSVILCFDLSQSAPKYLFTHSLNFRIVNISNVNGQLCVISPTEVQTFSVSATALTRDENKTYPFENIVDVTFGKYTQPLTATSLDVTYLFSNDGLQLYYENNSNTPDGPKIENASATLYVSAEDNSDLGGYVYNIFNGDVKRFDGTNWALNSDSFNKNGVLFAQNFAPMGIFQCNINGSATVALYNAEGIYKLSKTQYQTGVQSGDYVATKELFERSLSDKTIPIRDICALENKILILNSNNQIEIYAYNEESATFNRDDATIGTDTISFDELPTKFTSYTLAKSNGYPTNIIYKTADADTSIEEIRTETTDEFIILDFDGAEELGFYYVLVGDKYGWIKKSDGVSVPQNDPKLEIIPTETNQDMPNVAIGAKFSSANTVFIYELPLSDSNKTSFKQTLDNPQSVLLLQSFTEVKEDGTTVDWYYIEYGDGLHGFIEKGNVSKPYIAQVYYDTVETSWAKINSSLFEAVKLYYDVDMLEEIYDENGSVIKLYSGDRVRPIKENGNLTWVEVRDNDNQLVAAGWISTENLIGVHQITTNAIVGLSLLAAAIIVSTVFIVLFLKRKKSNAVKPAE